jgi:hypothetical protein
VTTVAPIAIANRIALIVAGSIPRSPAAPQQRHRDQPAGERNREHEPAENVDPARPARSVPAVEGRPAEGQRDKPDGNVEVEHPAPRRAEEVEQRPLADARVRERGPDVNRIEDRRAEERSGRHAEERQCPHDAECSRPGVAIEQVRGGRRPDRHEHTAADGLDEPRRDQLVEGLGPAGQRGADDEHSQRAQEQAPRSPQVGQPPGERHRDDVRQQVRVDDPGRLPQLGKGEHRVLCEVEDDRRQRHGGDHQLEPGEEDPHPEDGEQHDRSGSVHRASVPASRRQTGLDTAPAGE